MGNRAVIGWQDHDGKFSEDSVGVYFHWNGGRDSVEAFLAYCEMVGFVSPTYDNYGIARFAQVAANWFGGDGLCIGVDRIDRLDADNGDNGLYICNGWRIVDRRYHHGKEQLIYSLIDFVHDINEKQPDNLRKSEDKLDAMIDAYFDKYGEAMRRTSKAA